MKYQVREGRNRVIILALCALSLLVFILAVSNVVIRGKPATYS